MGQAGLSTQIRAKFYWSHALGIGASIEIGGKKRLERVSTNTGRRVGSRWPWDKACWIKLHLASAAAWELCRPQTDPQHGITIISPPVVLQSCPVQASDTSQGLPSDFPPQSAASLLQHLFFDSVSLYHLPEAVAVAVAEVQDLPPSSRAAHTRRIQRAYLPMVASSVLHFHRVRISFLVSSTGSFSCLYRPSFAGRCFHQVCQVPSAALAVCLRIATSVVATFLSYQLQKAASANEMSSPESAAKSASCLEPKDSNNHKLSLFCSKLGSHSGLV
nr:hypothetical protein Iba_chr11fCG13650 [Ipomoea batatas]